MVTFDSKSDNALKFFATLPDSMVNVLVVKRRCPPRTDVVQLDDDSNSVNSLSAARALVASVYPNTGVLYSNNSFWREVGKKTYLLKRSRSLSGVGASAPINKTSLINLFGTYPSGGGCGGRESRSCGKLGGVRFIILTSATCYRSV